MTLVFAPIDKITCDVFVDVPVDGTKTKRQEFKATFRKLNTDEKKRLTRSLAYAGANHAAREEILKDNSDIDPDITDFDLMMENVIDLSGVKGPDDQDLDYSEDLLKAMLNETYILSAMMKAFMAITYDQSVKEAYRRKN